MRFAILAASHVLYCCFVILMMKKLYIGNEWVLSTPSIANGAVDVAVRPEGFVLGEQGSLNCQLNRVEVMGRDISVVSTHASSQNEFVRSIISAENMAQIAGNTVRFDLKKDKVFLFHKETEQRIEF